MAPKASDSSTESSNAPEASPLPGVPADPVFAPAARLLHPVHRPSPLRQQIERSESSSAGSSRQFAYDVSDDDEEDDHITATSIYNPQSSANGRTDLVDHGEEGDVEMIDQMVDENGNPINASSISRTGGVSGGFNPQDMGKGVDKGKGIDMGSGYDKGKRPAYESTAPLTPYERREQDYVDDALFQAGKEASLKEIAQWRSAAGFEKEAGPSGVRAMEEEMDEDLIRIIKATSLEDLPKHLHARHDRFYGGTGATKYIAGLVSEVAALQKQWEQEDLEYRQAAAKWNASHDRGPWTARAPTPPPYTVGPQPAQAQPTQAQPAQQPRNENYEYDVAGNIDWMAKARKQTLQQNPGLAGNQKYIQMLAESLEEAYSAELAATAMDIDAPPSPTNGSAMHVDSPASPTNITPANDTPAEADTQLPTAEQVGAELERAEHKINWIGMAYELFLEDSPKLAYNGKELLKMARVIKKEYMQGLREGEYTDFLTNPCDGALPAECQDITVSKHGVVCRKQDLESDEGIDWEAEARKYAVMNGYDVDDPDFIRDLARGMKIHWAEIRPGAKRVESAGVAGAILEEDTDVTTTEDESEIESVAGVNATPNDGPAPADEKPKSKLLPIFCCKKLKPTSPVDMQNISMRLVTKFIDAGGSPAGSAIDARAEGTVNEKIWTEHEFYFGTTDQSHPRGYGPLGVASKVRYYAVPMHISAKKGENDGIEPIEIFVDPFTRPEITTKGEAMNRVRYQAMDECLIRDGSVDFKCKKHDKDWTVYTLKYQAAQNPELQKKQK